MPLKIRINGPPKDKIPKRLSQSLGGHKLEVATSSELFRAGRPDLVDDLVVNINQIIKLIGNKKIKKEWKKWASHNPSPYFLIFEFNVIEQLIY